ncbi:uncharacterized protein LOC124716851 [Schistocerca piceifrons]|uniref:uncharacterized protein LOC124716851 n=1 Tax=Schistocerca piceifrons TaxID=274613 RepID=UPI001F5FCA85|nr:uncharacterized protein LOC124716851 [Schistocerca piceifrons]
MLTACDSLSVSTTADNASTGGSCSVAGSAGGERHFGARLCLLASPQLLRCARPLKLDKEYLLPAVQLPLLNDRLLSYQGQYIAFCDEFSAQCEKQQPEPSVMFGLADALYAFYRRHWSEELRTYFPYYKYGVYGELLPQRRHLVIIKEEWQMEDRSSPWTLAACSCWPTPWITPRAHWKTCLRKPLSGASSAVCSCGTTCHRGRPTYPSPATWPTRRGPTSTSASSPG